MTFIQWQVVVKDGLKLRLWGKKKKKDADIA